MATVQCPSCNCSFEAKTTNALAAILKIVATLVMVGFLLIIVCLTAVASIGTSAEGDLSQKEQIRAKLQTLDYPSESSSKRSSS